MRKQGIVFGDGFSFYLVSAIVIAILIVLFIIIPKFTHSMDTVVSKLTMPIP
ncbi:MAG: hypothetical protein O8C64_05975 [Candidatus Methanoperedens sp.]|nr:hypothetical protein [Candidatus Methanoperedens sp.]MCZ7404962.1 hypothetical protein [Candidatus Methanoperedens sp.]